MNDTQIETKRETRGCCDHGCVIDPPKGMGTNARCMCPDWKLRREIQLLRQERDTLRDAAKLAERELRWCVHGAGRRGGGYEEALNALRAALAQQPEVKE